MFSVNRMLQEKKKKKGLGLTEQDFPPDTSSMSAKPGPVREREVSNILIKIALTVYLIVLLLFSV